MTPIYTSTTVRLTASFAGFDGLNVDPLSVEVRVKGPAAAVMTASFPTGLWVHPETGVFGFDVVVDDAGTWSYSFEAGGNIDAYNESTFTVVDRSF